MSTYTWQPDEASSNDTTILSNNPTTNYDGVSYQLRVGEDNSTVAVGRTLFKIDFGTIPTDVTIVSCDLELTVVDDLSSNARTMRAYRFKTDWVETEATWNRRSTASAWTAAGGFHATDCEQTDIGSVTQPASPAGGDKLTISLNPASVQEWLNGVFANNGFLLKVDTESNDCIRYCQSANATAGNRPKFTIVYDDGGSLVTWWN